MSDENVRLNWDPDRHDRDREELRNSERQNRIETNIRDYWVKWAKRDKKAKTVSKMIENLEELDAAVVRMVGDFEGLQDWLTTTRQMIHGKIAQVRGRASSASSPASGLEGLFGAGAQN